MDFKRLSGDEMITSHNIENVVAEETKDRNFFCGISVLYSPFFRIFN